MSTTSCNGEVAKREQDKPWWRRRMIYVEREQRTECCRKRDRSGIRVVPPRRGTEG